MSELGIAILGIEQFSQLQPILSLILSLTLSVILSLFLSLTLLLIPSLTCLNCHVTAQFDATQAGVQNKQPHAYCEQAQVASSRRDNNKVGNKSRTSS